MTRRDDGGTDDGGERGRHGAPVSRRDAVAWLVAAPALGAIDWTAAQAQRTAARLSEVATGAEGASPYAPRFFDPHEWRTVVILVDDVLPRDARSGSATEAKVPEFMDVLLADADTSAATRTAMRGGLAWIDFACEARCGKTFFRSTDPERRALLDEIAWPKRARPEVRAGAAFFSRFRDLTATGFFSSAMGWKDLRYLGNVAVAEWTGCPRAALDKLGVSDEIMDARPTKR